MLTWLMAKINIIFMPHTQPHVLTCQHIHKKTNKQIDIFCSLLQGVKSNMAMMKTLKTKGKKKSVSRRY